MPGAGSGGISATESPGTASGDKAVLLILLDRRDTVAVAPVDLPAQTLAALPGGGSILLRTEVRRGHKVALVGHSPGQPVIKYGHSIGRAGSAIEAGDWVHTHNLASTIAGELDYGQAPQEASVSPLPPFPQGLPRTFLGYRREDGRVGTRNQVWIIPTVGCVNGVAQRLASRAQAAWGQGASALVEPSASESQVETLEFLALTHPYGCSQLGDDLAHTRRILASLARHPNAAGVLVLGLGCENNLIDGFLEEIGPRPAGSLRAVRLQDEEDEDAAAMAALEALARYASGFRREPVPASELVLGLKCGGSDGFSGITANPLVGQVSDLAVSAGGSALLTEVPEMFGAEEGLLARASTPAVWQGTVDMVNHWKAYFLGHGQGSHENPSPGNREGGITTIEEKSSGCVRKAGTSPVMDIIPYGGTQRLPGLSLVSGPGNDLVSSTALAAAGAGVIIFTTGRGTPFGSIVPTIKVSTTSVLARRKPRWIDWDSGPLLEGADAAGLAAELWSLVLQTASGTRTRSELALCREIAIFKDGVTL